MKKKKAFSVYKSDNRKCLFPEQFELWERSDWNDDLPPFFKRLNNIEDDRSFVILATSVLEYQIDRFLKAFIPNHQILINDKTNLFTKINLIRAFNLIPEHFPDMLDNIRKIRNDFAHNLKIDSFNDANESEKLPGHIEEMRRLWDKFQNDMCYWQNDKPLRLMFKDIWRVCVEGLRVFESNVRLFRQETEKKEFINHLNKLSMELKDIRESAERESVLKMYMPWRK
ncbi:MAG: hypothetical protein CMP76_16920 [Flavobacterium sp.]|uniref:DUF4145 domain-containing protein n=1 Tax=Flavobacterium sp. TaxID=239 RepID=UPI000C44D36A|nr:DUF4145 domain-containing protein [Flavobacterium sp.]MBF04964.1 hypothetical protein [Flavobacterium sp.]|tara:strand:+ start:5014 stop:5694 length:681 start_codon:yes stop_codon:yes gene_type:complete